MLVNELKSYYQALQLNPQSTLAYRRNRLKEALHIYVLDFLYKHNDFRALIFYGGTCLRYCFGLPRLSEALDFEYLDGDFDLRRLEGDMLDYFRVSLGYPELSTSVQKFRLYLKFPVLHALQIATLDQSDYLHVKIEVNSTTRLLSSYAVEIEPIFRIQRTFFIKRYDLPTLMASKICALVNRTWMRHHKEQGVVSDAKGRDYYDLIWYMHKAIQPRWAFTGFASKETMWSVVGEKVKSVSTRSIENDLVDFLENPAEARDFATNLKASYDALYLKHYAVR
ncbi:MAG: nucleotidyl transferase AbiEii/AbiGii toxin family protein [Deltaproteobacteria bacterium]|nr:nucleotidyl transferase AbiEii/AbiGii toxin family protein [Deltaproteobacteria bacterium]